MDTALTETLAGLPERPGIYKMVDAGGKIIYIGKSKCLKKRVHSYFVPEPKWEKAKKMRSFIVRVEYQVTDTHLEAQLLECRLIKKMKPYFNVMMKNDERYFFLSVEEDYRKNPLWISRERMKDSFGPLRRRGPVEEMMGAFRNLYPLDKVRGRYTFAYHVLPEKLNKEDFLKNRAILSELFSNSRALLCFIKVLEKKMQETAKLQQFERAMKYRDLIQNLNYLCHCLYKFELFRNKDLLYRVPMGEGSKIFYIQKGRIIACKKIDGISGENAGKELFGEDLIEMQANADIFQEEELSEKSCVDYEDILFAELSQAPEKFITIL